MTYSLRNFELTDIEQMTQIWNDIVEDGIYFPQIDPLSFDEAVEFFSLQTRTIVADEDGEIIGLYILHPNNIGRCGHIANASYAVKSNQRGKHIGETLVKHSLETAKTTGFKLLQFNAVVATNKGAIHLYKRLGFQELGTVKNGFLKKDGTYEDIIPFYIELD